MMFGATLQAAVTILVATALATYVWLRAARTPLRGPLLGLMLALILWSSGVIWRFAAHTDELLLGLGYARAEIDELKTRAVVA